MDEVTRQRRNRLPGGNRVGGEPQETQETIGNRASDVIRSPAESVRRLAAGYPFSAILGSFALGAATGAVLGALLIESPRPRWYERVPDALGRRWIEALIEALPETVRSKVK